MVSDRLVTTGGVFGAGRLAGSIWKRRPISCSARKFWASSSFAAGDWSAPADESASTPTASATRLMPEFFVMAAPSHKPAKDSLQPDRSSAQRGVYPGDRTSRANSSLRFTARSLERDGAPLVH